MPTPDPLAPTPEFLAAAADLGIAFEPGDLDKLTRFLQLLLTANTQFNLTAITDPAQAWTKHIFDALTLLPVIESAKQEKSEAVKTSGTGVPPVSPSLRHSITPSLLSIIDIGSGGGLPAIPLAILLPDVHFTLVEATAKKADYLRDCAQKLNLPNITVLNDRAERLGQDHKHHRERYDLAIARAVGHLAILAELLGPLVRRHGLVIAVKGAKAEQELEESTKALALIGLKHLETLATPTGRLVILEKTTLTPRLYPRRDGEPARLPLGLDRDKPKS